MEGLPNCVHCGQPVEVHREQYEVFEKMHWLCFHLVFEHQGDPDQACGDPSCPWWHIEVFRRALEREGKDPQEILGAAIDERWPM